MPKLGQKIRHRETNEQWEFMGYAGAKWRVRNESGIKRLSPELFITAGTCLPREEREKRAEFRKANKKAFYIRKALLLK